MAVETQVQPLWVATGDPTTVSEVTPFAPGQLGMVVNVKNSTLFDPGKSPRIYQYVQLKAAATSGKGFPVIWDDLDNYVVTTVGAGTIANCGRLAGFTPSTSLAASSYGFIQCGGQGPVTVKAATTVVAGDLIFPSNADGEVDTLAPTLTAATRPWVPLYGVALSVKNAGSIGTHVIEALISIPFRHGW